MAVKKIKSLKGEIDCPYCFSLLQWDDVKDIKVSNGNQYITCPECGQNVLLDKEKDYWVESDDSTPEGGGGSCDAVIVDTLPEVGEEGKIYLYKKYPTYYGHEDPETTEIYWNNYGTSAIELTSETFPPASAFSNDSVYGILGDSLYYPSNDYTTWELQSDNMISGDVPPTEGTAAVNTIYIVKGTYAYYEMVYSNNKWSELNNIVYGLPDDIR